MQKNKIWITLILLNCVFSTAYAQKYFTREGKTEFKASVQAFEPVEAVNKSTTAILNSETGEVAALLFIKAFRFEVALMEEHFNENYMHSDELPKASFKGKIVHFSFKDVPSDFKSYDMVGVMQIKGEKNEISTTINIKKQDGHLIIASDFDLDPEDFEIEIPRIVRDKIAKKVKVNLEYELVKKD